MEMDVLSVPTITGFASLRFVCVSMYGAQRVLRHDSLGRVCEEGPRDDEPSHGHLEMG